MLWISERIVLFLILFFWCSLSIFSVFPPSYSFFFPSSLVWLYPEHFFFFLPSSSLFSIPSCPLFYAPYTFSMPPRFFFPPSSLFVSLVPLHIHEYFIFFLLTPSVTPNGRRTYGCLIPPMIRCYFFSYMNLFPHDILFPLYYFLL